MRKPLPETSTSIVLGIGLYVSLVTLTGYTVPLCMRLTRWKLLFPLCQSGERGCIDYRKLITKKLFKFLSCPSYSIFNDICRNVLFPVMDYGMVYSFSAYIFWPVCFCVSEWCLFEFLEDYQDEIVPDGMFWCIPWIGFISGIISLSFWTISFIFPENEYHLGSNPFLLPMLSPLIIFWFWRY